MRGLLATSYILLGSALVRALPGQTTGPPTQEHFNTPSGARRHPYGFWDSPITPDWMVRQDSTLADIFVDKLSGEVYVSEIRPNEGGRNVLRKYHSREAVFEDPQWDARTAVHEYGGGHATVFNGTVYFSNLPDGRVYQVKPGGAPTPVTPASWKVRYADFDVHPVHPRFVAAVIEDHTFDDPTAPAARRCIKNRIGVIDTEAGIVKALDLGTGDGPPQPCPLGTPSVLDFFYDKPRFSPDGEYLVMRTWAHPYMSWEASGLLIAQIELNPDTYHESDSLLLRDIHIVPADGESAFGELNWVNSTRFVLTNDVSGYFNPWILDVGARLSMKPVAKSPIAEDFGEATWWLGMSAMAVLDENHIVAASFRDGRSQLYVFRLSDGTYRNLHSPFAYISYLRRITDGRVVFVATTDTQAASVVELRIDPRHLDKPLFFMDAELITGEDIPPSYISTPESFTFEHPTTGEPIHAVYYPPTNPEYSGGLPGELPPVVVNVHGGPTYQTTQGLSWTTQLFTSRGFAWLDVNYGGSMMYGRAYRERLLGKWGLVDVEDSVIAVKELGKLGRLDATRATIRGGSAGGFTTFAALANEPDFFAAGMSMFGVSDLRTLQAVLHKFESHYLLKYVGGSPETDPGLWWRRSPISKADKIKSPLLILQGASDTVVPVDQAVEMLHQIKRNGGRAELHIFEGEGHGWRQAQTIREALEREIAWYQGVFNGSVTQGV